MNDLILAIFWKNIQFCDILVMQEASFEELFEDLLKDSESLPQVAEYLKEN